MANLNAIDGYMKKNKKDLFGEDPNAPAKPGMPGKSGMPEMPSPEAEAPETDFEDLFSSDGADEASMPGENPEEEASEPAIAAAIEDAWGQPLPPEKLSQIMEILRGTSPAEKPMVGGGAAPSGVEKLKKLGAPKPPMPGMPPV